MLNRRGMCHLCGRIGPLTFEHIPPKRVFNDKPCVAETVEALVRTKGRSGRKRFPRGMGKHSLCSQCNQRTADIYGGAFAEWTSQALQFAGAVGEDAVLHLGFDLYPLKVLKQIAVMCLAETDFAPGYHTELRRFVLSPARRHCPPKYRFYAYFNPIGTPRISGMGVALNVRTGIRFMVLAEIGFPPMGYCLMGTEASDEQVARRLRLCDITPFSRCELDERRHLWLRIPRLDPLGPAPLAFRGKEQ